MKRDEIASSLLLETLEAVEREIQQSRMARKALVRHAEVIEFLDRAGVVETIELFGTPVVHCRLNDELTPAEVATISLFLRTKSCGFKHFKHYTFDKPALTVLFH